MVHLARNKVKWLAFVKGRRTVWVNPPKCKEVVGVNGLAGPNDENGDLGCEPTK